MKFFLLVALFLLHSVLPTLAQRKAASSTVIQEPPTRFAEAITTAELRRHLTELASDEYQGRGTGQAGQKKAAAYLTHQFELLGLQGVGPSAATSYVQPFSLIKTVPTNPGWIQVGSQTFEGSKHFLRAGSSTFPEGTTLTDPVFRGFGIETSSYDDYAGLPDVRGKDVIVLYGEPHNGMGRYLFSGSKKQSEWSSGFRKAYIAREKGARSITFVTDAPVALFQQQLQPMLSELTAPSYSLATPTLQPTDETLMQNYEPAYISMFITDAPLGTSLLNTTPAVVQSYEIACYKTGKPVKANFQPVSFQVQFPEQRQELATENVLGFLEGSDKKEEVLVVSAHYDHLGIQHDTIYNGADEDASGTSAVLAMAKAFQEAKAAGKGPRRSILFLLTAAEEQGMLGSSFYVTHPTFALTQVVGNLNIAMLGRTDKKHTGKAPYVYLVGSDRLSPELHALSEATNAQTTRLKLDYAYNVSTSADQLFYRSDQYNFARYGIPVIAYTSGIHNDYHKSTDDVEKIEFDKLAERTRLVFYTAWEITNRDQRLVVDSNKK